MATHTPKTFALTGATKPAQEQVQPLPVRDAKGQQVWHDYTSSSPVVQAKFEEFDAAYTALVESEVYKTERAARKAFLEVAIADLQNSQNPLIVATRAANPGMTPTVVFKFGRTAFSMVEPKAKKAKLVI